MLHTLGSSVESFGAWVKLGTYSLTTWGSRRLVLLLGLSRDFLGCTFGLRLGLCLGLRTRCLRSEWPAKRRPLKIWGLVM